MAVLDLKNSALEKWGAVIQKCFNKRLRPASVGKALQQLQKESPVPGSDIARVIIEAVYTDAECTDPLLLHYMIHCLDASLIDTADVLAASLASSSEGAPQNPSSRHEVAHRRSAPADATLLQALFGLLSRCYARGSSPANLQEAWRVVYHLRRWLDAFVRDRIERPISDEVYNPASETPIVCEQLAILVLHIIASPTIKRCLTDSLDETGRTAFETSVIDFITTLASFVPTSLALSQLQASVRLPPLASINPERLEALTHDEICNTVSNLPPSISRAGLYLYLNAVLESGPLVDDASIFGHLLARYGTQTQTLIVDLILATFDAYANVLQSNSNAQVISYHRSFIANKLPLLVASLSVELYPPQTLEESIRLATTRLDVNTFSSLTADSTGINSVIRESRCEFLLACCLLQMIPTAYAVEVTGQRPTRGRYNKETLISQCGSNLRRVEELVNELDRYDGNTGAISSALVVILEGYHDSKDATSLKSVSLALCKSISRLDIVPQHVSLTSLLRPICEHLNSWSHDEDQNEFQPAYEEFSAALLLVLAMAHRYGLQAVKPSLGGCKSYLSKLILRGPLSTSQKDLSSDQSKYLTMWVKGLFGTDEQGESSGISDDVLSQCSPQDFYLIVPTLFEQSVVACECKVLALEAFLGGLEFLLEPFLLPSLIGVLQWIAIQPWESHGDVKMIVQVLDKLLRPPTISGDAENMHRVVLTVAARPLLVALERIMARSLPDKDVIDKLKSSLTPLQDAQRSSHTSLEEAESWVSSPGGLSGSVRCLVSQTVSWISQGDLGSMPPHYTHRMVSTAVDLVGAEQIISSLIDEVVEQTALGLGPVALEAATTLICAPRSTSESEDDGATDPSQQTKALRRALQLFGSSPKDLLDMNMVRCEAYVRLVRLVEAQCTTMQVSHLQAPVLAATSAEPMTELETSTTAGMAAAQAVVAEAMNINSATTTSGDFAMVLDPTAVAGVVRGQGESMQLDLPENLFGAGGQAIDFSLSSQPLGATTGENRHAASVDSASLLGIGGQGTEDLRAVEPLVGGGGEDDIFAGLDFGGMGEDEFTF